AHEAADDFALLAAVPEAHLERRALQVKDGQRRRRRGTDRGRGRRGRELDGRVRRRGRSPVEPFDDEAEDVAEGGEVAQREPVVGDEVEALADAAEDLRLLDAVDSQVGFHVEVEAYEVRR